MIKIFWALPPLHFYCQWDTGRNFFLIWDSSSSCQHLIWVNLAKTYYLHFHRTDFSCVSKPQLKIQCLSSSESKRVFSNICSAQQRGGAITLFIFITNLRAYCLFWRFLLSFGDNIRIRARWFLWNVSANPHMTSVTKRNMLDPTGKVGDCSYTPHNHHPLGWIFFTRQKIWVFLLFLFFQKA